MSVSQLAWEAQRLVKSPIASPAPHLTALVGPHAVEGILHHSDVVTRSTHPQSDRETGQNLYMSFQESR
jgi:hypothetical protein